MWTVVTRKTDGSLWERQRFDTEDEAREVAAQIGTVRGQFAWTNDVCGPDGKVRDTYRGGRIVRRRQERAA